MTAEVSEGFERIWRPNKRQQDFLKIPDTFFEGFYGGAAGGGKSEVLLMLPIARQFFLNPRFKGIIFRKSYRQLEDSLIPRSFELGYEAFGFKYNHSKHVWTHRDTGATIRFGFMDKDSDARQHDTAEYNYIAWDELTHFNEWPYRYLMSRCRTSSPDLPAFMRAASNPGNIGHTWVRRRFVELAKEGYAKIFDVASNTYRVFIPAKLTDNPDLMKSDPSYGDRLKALPSEAERKSKIDGDWWAFAGQVFTEFRISPYSDEPQNAQHVIEPFEIPDWWPKIIAIDWGYKASTAVGWYALSPDERIFKYRELNRKGLTVEEWGADVQRMSQFDGNIVSVVIDPSAEQNRGEAHTIRQRAQRATGFLISLANNDRVGGKDILHSFLRWEPRPKKYVPPEGYSQETRDKIYRLYGEEAANRYAGMFVEDEPETNIPRLQIFDTCQHTINAIQVCTYDEDAKGKKIEDVKEFDGDDPYDETRYGLYRVDSFYKGVREEHDQRREINEVLNKLAATGNQTTFYREMEQLEAAGKKTPRTYAPRGRSRRKIRGRRNRVIPWRN